MPCKTSGMQFIKLLKDRVPYTFRKFILLYFSAFLFVISVCTSNWFVCSLEVKTGVWSICYHTAPFWHCIAFETNFAVTVQAFSMMCILGYVCTSVYPFLTNRYKTSTSKSFILLLSLCLLCLSIASLQMMTLVIYAIKVKDSINRITKTFYSTESCSVSWSFGLTLISIVMTTISAILAFSEIKKFAKEKNNDNIQANNTVNGVESQSGV